MSLEWVERQKESHHKLWGNISGRAHTYTLVSNKAIRVIPGLRVADHKSAGARTKGAWYEQSSGCLKGQ